MTKEAVPVEYLELLVGVEVEHSTANRVAKGGGDRHSVFPAFFIKVSLHRLVMCLARQDNKTSVGRSNISRYQQEHPNVQ